ncbi:uncharacterized protein ACO6RY_11037 [Pungitius sinensis]
MGDSEEAKFFWESWTWTPEKEKKKKDAKKDKKGLKRKNNMTKKTDHTNEKKKKKSNSKFKDAVKERKEKKKGKKKKQLPLELDDSLIHTHATPAVKPHTLDQQSIDKLKPDQDCKKKSRRKHKVAFDLSRSIHSARKASFVSCCQQSPKNKILSEPEAVRELRQSQWHPNASQSASEDINSQDLFITQKTFRASSSQPSSGEASDKAGMGSPPMFPPRDELHSCKAWTKPQDSPCHQHLTKTYQQVQKPKTLQVLLTDGEEEEERTIQTHLHLEKGKCATKEKKVSPPALTGPRVPNPFMSEPFQLSPSLDVAHSRKHLCASSEPPLSCPLPISTESTSTQTENFFTTELCAYLTFCQRSRVAIPVEDLQPLDLSMQHRARKDLGKGLTEKTLSSPAESTEPDLRPCCSSNMTDGAVTEEASGHHPYPGIASEKRKTTPSPVSESDPKSADTSASSEDEPPCRNGRLDLTQVRAVQMRLNESFFFKTKGKGQSPRPQSPLMKLAQGRQVKSRKGH